ncbi:hypothetical protein [Nesterenkonia muleiensis]|uniref:hypothetical protein n=1 Tax=Nesterenkonia muleiensis TaxID=2282648 RepID=UPI000E766F4D|nr:hypothetical protein [Nesterenkonia muleiensis]
MSEALDFDPKTDTPFDKFGNLSKAEAMRQLAASDINEELYAAELNAEYDAYAVVRPRESLPRSSTPSLALTRNDPFSCLNHPRGD